MLSNEENERLTRVGPGTPMGETLRRYWMPILHSWELPEPDCPPVRVKLLGEDLVAFRATDGQLGLLEEFCPHRGASLWLGRNEENGLRCVYHGWKYDVGGRCVDQMNEPKQFASKVRVKAYPSIELGGVIWGYLGPEEKQPAPPKFEWTEAPETHCSVSKVMQDCNWLQALEGGIDTSHFSILHRALKESPTQAGIAVDDPGVRSGAPALELDITDYGYRYFGVRPLDDDDVFVRGYHFVMPFTQIRPYAPTSKESRGHFWVPMDDETCMVWNWYHSYGNDPVGDVSDQGNIYGVHVDADAGFRSIGNRSNSWNIDRQAQKNETFTGIDGVNLQDRAVQESMRPIQDRTREHLGPADKAIIATRKLLQRAMDVVAENGDPMGTAPTYYELRAAEGIMSKETDWREVLLPLMYPKTGGIGSGDRFEVSPDEIQVLD